LKMPEVYLIGELRMKNFEIFRLMQTKEDGWNYVIGFLLIEDCNRKSRISDYPFLEEVYKDTPEEFDTSENIIKLQAVITEPMAEEDIEVLEHISVSLVEFKEQTAVTFSVIVREDLNELIGLLDENPFAVYTELLLYTEAKPTVSHFKKESLRRLLQEDSS